jgi:hypothetical protein
VEYLQQEESLNIAVLVCKQWHRAVEKAATAALTRIDEKQNCVDETFWFRVGHHVDAFADRTNPRLSLSRLLSPRPARVVLRAAHVIAMKQSTTEHAGPSALLPDGNIAIYCRGDCLIRIFDTSTFQLPFCEERVQGCGDFALEN